MHQNCKLELGTWNSLKNKDICNLDSWKLGIIVLLYSWKRAIFTQRGIYVTEVVTSGRWSYTGGLFINICIRWPALNATPRRKTDSGFLYSRAPNKRCFLNKTVARLEARLFKWFNWTTRFLKKRQNWTTWFSAFGKQLEIWEPIISSLNHLIQNSNGATRISYWISCNPKNFHILMTIFKGLFGILCDNLVESLQKLDNFRISKSVLRPKVNLILLKMIFVYGKKIKRTNLCIPSTKLFYEISRYSLSLFIRM